MPRAFRRLRRLATHSPLSFRLYRYRYLAAFTAIGLLSILLEIGLVSQMPADWPWPVRAGLGFAAALAVSFWLNARLNFNVPPAHLTRTFGRFALVSGLSFALNMAAVSGAKLWLESDYASARLVSSGVLFVVAYTLHRRYTFDLARNFGVAVYAARDERVYRIFGKLGRTCDHIHVDLVDETMNPAAAAVDLSKFDLVRKLWPGTPVHLHLMSLKPGLWVRRVLDRVDAVIVHVNAEDDLFELIADCRLAGKQVGVAWHRAARVSDLLPYLPHVDFVLVLGIAKPGQSGQPLQDEAVQVAATLDALRPRYGFDVVFDGGVNADTVRRIRAKFVVAASAVLRAANPVRAAHTLRTGARYERRAA